MSRIRSGFDASMQHTSSTATLESSVAASASNDESIEMTDILRESHHHDGVAPTLLPAKSRSGAPIPDSCGHAVRASCLESHSER